MSLLTTRTRPFFLLATGLVFVLTFFVRTDADSPIIVVSTDDLTALPGQQDVTIPVYLNNFGDSIGGLTLYLELDRPDIFEFEMTEDNSGPETVYWVTFDTTGTLLSGWGYLKAVSLGGTGYNAKIIAIAEEARGLGLYDGDMPLIKLTCNVYDIPDTTTERTAEIRFSRSLMQTQFSDVWGEYLIGVIADTLIDTTCYNCTEWSLPDSICLYWEPMPGVQGDSCVIDTSVTLRLDTSQVWLQDGSLTVLDDFVCGDLTGDDLVNILDVVAFIAFIYEGYQDPQMPVHYYDFDGSGALNMLDIVYLINYIYNGGPEPICE